MNEKTADCNIAGSGWRPGSRLARHLAGALLLGTQLLLPSAAIAGDGVSATPEYLIEISKSERELHVIYANHLIRSYPISYGKGGRGTKQVRGDNKTPVGSYRIVDFNDDSRFFFFMQLDYPNMRDGWYGYRNHLITASQFKAIAVAFRNGDTPPQDTALGGFIGIHGIGDDSTEKLEIHRHQNWTEGCIALRNEEVDELRKFVHVGTRVIIRE